MVLDQKENIHIAEDLVDEKINRKFLRLIFYKRNPDSGEQWKP